MGVTGYISPGVKQPGCETDHPPPSSVKVKNADAWSYTSTPPYILMAWCLIKNKETLLIPYKMSFNEI
jgi:hypothetical protein